jgi:chromosome segregation ATPase
MFQLMALFSYKWSGIECHCKEFESGVKHGRSHKHGHRGTGAVAYLPGTGVKRMARARNHGNGRLEESLTAMQQAQAQMLQALASLAQTQAATLARMAATDAEIGELRRETNRDVAEIRRELGEHSERLERIEALLAGLPEAVHRRFGFQPPQPPTE